jgi:hypothetical protein
MTARYREIISTIKAAEKRMAEISELQKHVSNYIRTKDIYKAYHEAGYSKKYRSAHEAAIILHQDAKRHFDSLGLKKLPTINMLKQEYAIRLAEKKKSFGQYHEAKEAMQKFQMAKSNTDRILGVGSLGSNKEAREAKADTRSHEI